MAQAINLRLARKARARIAKAVAADANRAAFGRNRTERTAASAETDRRDRELDGARRDC